MRHVSLHLASVPLLFSLGCSRPSGTTTGQEPRGAESPTALAIPAEAAAGSNTATSAAHDDAGMGNMWGDSVGDAFGAAAVDRSGIGATQGSRTDAGARRAVIRQGVTEVNGRLPPEIIQRTVRQNFGSFRLCYDVALKVHPELNGRVSAKFVIASNGSVRSVSNGGSDIPDPAMVACVLRVFRTLSFPQPEGGGKVAVTYPLIFAPPE
jgi:hypothetical protein